MGANHVNSPYSIFKHLVYFKASFGYNLCYTIKIYIPTTILLHGLGEC